VKFTQLCEKYSGKAGAGVSGQARKTDFFFFFFFLSRC